MTPNESEDLKMLLQQMQQEDPDFRVFGARQHHYCLGLTFTEADLHSSLGYLPPAEYETQLMKAYAEN